MAGFPQIPRAPSINVRKTEAMQESFSTHELQTASHRSFSIPHYLNTNLHNTVPIYRNSFTQNYHATHATLQHMAGLFSFPQFGLLHTHDYSLQAVSLINEKTFRTSAGLTLNHYKLSHYNRATLRNRVCQSSFTRNTLFSCSQI